MFNAGDEISVPGQGTKFQLPCGVAKKEEKKKKGRKEKGGMWESLEGGHFLRNFLTSGYYA